MRIEPGMKVLVTGAASGIGREIVRRLARFEVEFLLVDRDPTGLANLAAELKEQNLRATTHTCDLADAAQIDALAALVQQKWGGLQILINNAGIAWYGPTLKTPEGEWDRIMAVNLHAPIRLTRRLLPLLLEQPEAHVVNTASICGLVASSRLTAYSTSKFGLVGFGEAIRGEFGRFGLGVTTVCPGPVRTNLLTTTPSGRNDGKIPQPPRWTSTTPEHVAAAVVRGIQRDRAVVVITWMAKLVFWCKSLAPGLLDALQRNGRRKKIRQKIAKIEAKRTEAPAPRRAA